jgi:hypothetical protein
MATFAWRGLCCAYVTAKSVIKFAGPPKSGAIGEAPVVARLHQDLHASPGVGRSRVPEN